VRLPAQRPLERVRGAKHERLGEVPGAELPADRQPSTRPTGTLIAGTPARFALTVKASFRYIVYGSVIEPSGNAVVGAVGVKSRSTASNAWEKSRATSARTSCARR
jgi:hypothetical protein